LTKRFKYIHIHLKIGDENMEKSVEGIFISKWMEVVKVMDEARDRIKPIVQEILEIIIQLCGGEIQRLSVEKGFRYMFTVERNGSSDVSWIPVLIVDREDAVDLIKSRFPDIVTHGRLEVKFVPPMVFSKTFK